MSEQYRTGEGEMIDEIAWRYYGTRPGALEAVLEANPHLAEQPYHLPAGLVITLPDLPAPIGGTRLWESPA